MHLGLIDKLTVFARENNLSFDYDYDHKRDIYHFRFRSLETQWMYIVSISWYRVDAYKMSTEYLTSKITEEVRLAFNREN